MQTLTTVAALSAAIQQAKKENKSIGLVPTMGALHEGHLSLIHRARQENDIVVVSLFVNPIQFNNKEDLEKYPRTLEADCEKVSAAQADIAFAPSVEEMYPEEVTTVYHFGPIEEVMEGPRRPGPGASPFAAAGAPSSSASVGTGSSAPTTCRTRLASAL